MIKELKKININKLSEEELEIHIQNILMQNDKIIKEYIVYMCLEYNDDLEASDNERKIVLSGLRPYFRAFEHFMTTEQDEKIFIEKFLSDEKILGEKKKIIYQSADKVVTLESVTSVDKNL